MAPLAKALVAFFRIVVLADVAVGTNYTVGGSTWGLGTNYKMWAKTLTFRTGDSLIFDYDGTQHDMAEVTKANYDACNEVKPIYYDASGHTVIQLKEPGTRYFICTLPLHCSISNMKLEIKVVSSPGSKSTSSSSHAPSVTATKSPVTPSITPTTSVAPSISRHRAHPPSIAPTVHVAKSNTTTNSYILPPTPAFAPENDSFDSESPTDAMEMVGESSAVWKICVSKFTFVFIGLLMLISVC